MKILSLLLFPCLLLGALAAGCGGGSKTVDVGGNKVTVGGKVPSDFPNDFPQYKGASVESSVSGKTEGGITGTWVMWTTGDSVDKVTAYYTQSFKDGPWKSTTSGTAGGNSYWTANSPDGSKVGYVMVSSDSGKTSITAVVGPNDQTPTSDNTSTSGSGSSETPPSSQPSGESTSEATTSSSQPLPDEVKLSSDFPTDRVPLPDGARITSDTSFSSGGTKTNAIEFYVKDTPENVDNFFKTEAPKHNWTDAFSSQSNGQYLLTFGAGSNEGLTISIEQSETTGYAKVTLTVAVAQ